MVASSSVIGSPRSGCHPAGSLLAPIPPLFRSGPYVPRRFGYGPPDAERGTLMLEFEGKVAVVTGAGSGIGRALAHRFGAEGMRVALGDIEPQAAAETAALIAEATPGAEVLVHPVDVSRADQVDSVRRHGVRRVRSGRRALQQRRRLRRRIPVGTSGGRPRVRARRQPVGHPQRHPGVRPAHDRAGHRRPHRQHGVHRRVVGQQLLRAVQHLEVRRVRRHRVARR